MSSGQSTVWVPQLIPPLYSAAPIKRTAMERMVNVQILFLLAILLALSLACAIGSTIRTHVYGDDMWYLLLDDGGESNPVSASKFVKDVLTFILTLNNLIPISCVAWFSFADGLTLAQSLAPLTSQRRVRAGSS